MGIMMNQNTAEGKYIGETERNELVACDFGKHRFDFLQSSLML